MIKIKTKSGMELEFEGISDFLPEKRNQVEQTTIYGMKLSEHSRVVKNPNIKNCHLNKEQYDKLIDIFFYHNSYCTIYDSEKGEVYTGVYIVPDGVQIEEQKDYDKETYVYVGSIKFNKR